MNAVGSLITGSPPFSPTIQQKKTGKRRNTFSVTLFPPIPFDFYGVAYRSIVTPGQEFCQSSTGEGVHTRSCARRVELTGHQA